MNMEDDGAGLQVEVRSIIPLFCSGIAAILHCRDCPISWCRYRTGTLNANRSHSERSEPDIPTASGRDHQPPCPRNGWHPLDSEPSKEYRYAHQPYTVHSVRPYG